MTRKKPVKRTKRTPPLSGVRRTSKVKSTGSKQHGKTTSQRIRNGRTRRGGTGGPARRTSSRSVQLPKGRTTKRRASPAPRRKQQTHAPRRQVRKQTHRLSQTKAAIRARGRRNERRLEARVRELQAQVSELTKQPPAPFPTAREFRRAVSSGGGGGGPAIEPPAGYSEVSSGYRQSARSYAAELEEDAEESGEWEPSTTYDDFEDYDYDDYFDDVGDEDEDSYGEDAAR